MLSWVSRLKATPSHWSVLLKDQINSLGSIQPSCSSRSALLATQTQLPSLPAWYPFSTWVMWGNWDKETYPEPQFLWRAYSRAAVRDQRYKATQTQMPYLPATWIGAFSTWVRCGNCGKETYPESHADSGIPTWELDSNLTARQSSRGYSRHFMTNACRMSHKVYQLFQSDNIQLKSKLVLFEKILQPGVPGKQDTPSTVSLKVQFLQQATDKYKNFTHKITNCWYIHMYDRHTFVEWRSGSSACLIQCPGLESRLDLFLVW
jgi:hypothetical protein